MLFKNFFTISSLTACSRVLGLAREMILSHALGASWVVDVFIVAFKFPNFFRRFFAEGAFNAAFIPEFSKRSIETKPIAFVGNIFSFMMWFLIALCCLVLIFAEPLSYILAPGFQDEPEKAQHAIRLIRITFPFVIFISLTALLGGILNAYNRFVATSSAPLLLNIFMIFSLLTFNVFQVEATWSLSWAVLLSGGAQFLWMLFLVRKIGFRFKITKPKINDDTKLIMRKMLPGMVGAGVTQINIMVDLILASLLPTGAISYLYYADRLQQLPFAIIGVSIGTALLPALSKMYSQKKYKKLIETQNNAIKFGLSLAFPASIALIILSHPTIDLIYGHGKFSLDDINKTSPVLMFFAGAIPAYILQKVFSTIFFSRGDTKTPVRVSLISVGLNIVLSFIFMQKFAHIGLAMATTTSAWVNIIILFMALKKRGFFILTKSLKYYILQIFFRSLIMGAVILVAKKYLISEHTSSYEEILRYFALIGVGLFTVSILYFEHYKGFLRRQKFVKKLLFR